MIFRVSTLLKEPTGSSRDYDIDDRVEFEDGTTAPVVGHVRFVKAGPGILVAGKLITRVLQRCARCLKDVESSLTLDVEEEYLLSIDPATGARLDVGGDTEALTIDQSQEIDLQETVRQYALTALPIQPLCRPDCKGLCPNCGADLNVGPHECAVQPPDERWSELGKLKDLEEGS